MLVQALILSAVRNIQALTCEPMSHFHGVGRDWTSPFDVEDEYANVLGEDAQEHDYQCFVVVEFKRSPEAFRLSLELEPTLAACVRALSSVGVKCKWASQPKVFVHADHMPKLGRHLEIHGFTDMKRRHVVVDARLFGCLMRAVGPIPRRLQVKIKSFKSFGIGLPLAISPKPLIDVPLTISLSHDVLPKVRLDCKNRNEIDNTYIAYRVAPAAAKKTSEMMSAPQSWRVTDTCFAPEEPALIVCECWAKQTVSSIL